MKKITLAALLIAIGILGASHIVLAGNSILSASPASLSSTVGSVFNVFVRIDPADNKACVIKGTLVLDKLACQSITVASGLMAQTTPTCADPSFIIGIPKCATIEQNIFSVAVKGTVAGQGSLSFAGVKVIGAGADVLSSARGGVYDIAAVPAIAPETATKTAPKITPTAGSSAKPAAPLEIAPTSTPIETVATTTATTVAEVKLFDISLGIENALLDKSSDLVARTQFISFGTVPTLVNLVYSVVDLSGQKIYSEADTVTVETEQLVTKEFKNLDLASGRYTLVLSTTYGDNVQDEFRQAFEVKGAAAAANTGLVMAIWIISILVIVGIGAGIIYLFIKRKNNEQ
jgi:hypothetical protein